jgi:hypothetical protein
MSKRDAANAVVRYFPGSWNYDARYLMSRPKEERPYFRVEYRTEDELRAAQAVQPAFFQVEYVHVPAHGRASMPKRRPTAVHPR